MIGQASVLAVIPARGGSKGLTRKNLRPLAGRPLLAWTLDAARACDAIDRVILSSEDPEIIATARALGCEVPFARPDHLARDDTRAIEVALHLLKTLPERYDYLIWLQPTSPLRSAQDIAGTLRLCHDHNADSAVSVTPVDKNPHWMFHVAADSGTMQPLLPAAITDGNRQQLPAVHQLNGAVYVARTSWLIRQQRFLDPHTRAWIMPAERSIDIDCQRDLWLAEWWLSHAAGSAP